LNALILASRDARAGAASDEARTAFANLWALQFKRGDLAGGWAWLNFHLEPWESSDGAFFGAALAAIAVGSEPGGYADRADVEPQLKALREYLRRKSPSQTLFNRAALLWASSVLGGVLRPEQQQDIADSLWAKQRADGGWSLTSLGQYARSDKTSPDTVSDGYATGLVSLALQQAGAASQEPHVARALAWLVAHQDRATGKWSATSLNKQRDSSSDVGKFMSDAATAYAVLALTRAGESR
jgi:squalene-hopene/tetraprenyl-beta-curcumene cyclase